METSELHPKVDRMETSEDEKIRWKQSKTAKSMTDMRVQTRKSENEAWVEQKDAQRQGKLLKLCEKRFCIAFRVWETKH